MIANGRHLLPPATLPANRTGRTGSTHGEIAVITPARKAMPSRTTIAASVTAAELRVP
jgi:hypothetical protein